MADGIYQHVDVREEGKENAFSLGHTLWINNEVSWFCCGGGGCWSVAYRVFLIHCRSLKIWMKLLLGTFSQWRHLPGICWGISTSRSATGEAGRYVYWGLFFFLWHCSYNWVVSCLFVLSWLAHLILLILFFICQKMEELLMRTKREKPTFIPYFISACKDLPGKFILGYQPRAKPRYVEMFVSYFHERKCEVGCINVVQIYISLFICWKVSGWLTGRLSFMWNALFFILSIGLSMWLLPQMDSATVHRFFLRWMGFSGGLRTIFRTLCQVWKCYNYTL